MPDTITHQAGDVLQDQVGWFFRFDGTTLGCLSDTDVATFEPTATPPTGALRLLLRDGATLPGTGMAGRMAALLAERYTA